MKPGFKRIIYLFLIVLFAVFFAYNCAPVGNGDDDDDDDNGGVTTPTPVVTSSPTPVMTPTPTVITTPTPTPVITPITYTISGVVVDNEAQAIDSMVLSLGDVTTDTDSAGAFSFVIEKNGNYVLSGSGGLSPDTGEFKKYTFASRDIDVSGNVNVGTITAYDMYGYSLIVQNINPEIQTRRSRANPFTDNNPVFMTLTWQDAAEPAFQNYEVYLDYADNDVLVWSSETGSYVSETNGYKKISVDLEQSLSDVPDFSYSDTRYSFTVISGDGTSTKVMGRVNCSIGTYLTTFPSNFTIIGDDLTVTPPQNANTYVFNVYKDSPDTDKLFTGQATTPQITLPADIVTDTTGVYYAKVYSYYLDDNNYPLECVIGIDRVTRL